MYITYINILYIYAYCMGASIEILCLNNRFFSNKLYNISILYILCKYYAGNILFLVDRDILTPAIRNLRSIKYRDAHKLLVRYYLKKILTAITYSDVPPVGINSYEQYTICILLKTALHS